VFEQAEGSDTQRVGRQPSARARVLGWMLLLVGASVLASVLFARQLLLDDVDRQLNEELTHEASKFRAFAASDLDPTTGRRYTSVDELMARYLERNLPEEGQTFFTLVDGQPSRRSPGQPNARLDTDRRFIAHIRSATTPTSGTWNTSAGAARYATLPISIPGQLQTGTLVFVEFRAQLQGQTDHIIRILLGAAAISLLLAGVAGWAVAGRVLAPVRVMRRTAERITGTDLNGRIEVAGNDDVAALARTFNSMLDRLQTAFTGQRQFLDDAGHELRTPITVIRGHVEVMSDDPDDRAATVAMVLDELSRMSRIVDDLILLAKAERSDFLTTGDVDLGDLAIDVLAKAQTLGDRHWTLDEFADRVVHADRHRLTQALMQLASNAVRHTTATDTIAVGTAVRTTQAPTTATYPDGTLQVADLAGGTEGTLDSGERVLLWVRDTGEGIDPADHDRIFDRFSRGTNQRRSTEGAGLGLAIVTRIATAHGGTVRLESTPGHGATFTLDLPLVTIEEAAGDDTPPFDDAHTVESTVPDALGGPQTGVDNGIEATGVAADARARKDAGE
jgi:two-component system OmpR family sensor kinase